MVLVNSNPATIMTDPSVADRTYVEPLDVEAVEAVIAIERPDALLPTLGRPDGAQPRDGPRAPPACSTRYGVELIGADVEAIRRAEDREAFRDTMAAAGLAVPESRVVTDLAGGRARGRALGLPVILRPGYTLGGEGGGAAHTPEELERAPARRARREPDRPGAGGALGAGVGRDRAGGDARRGGQRGRDLLDREHRPDGGPHRRLGDRRPGDDPHRPGAAAAARRGDRGHPRGGRRHRRGQRPVRPQPRRPARWWSSR